MQKEYIAVALVCACFSAQIFAEKNKKIEELIVSATLTETSVFEVLGSASLIDASDILRIQPLDLSEIFEQQAGLDIVSNGGRASQTSLFTRGTNSSHTLVLINGQRFGSATLGRTEFQFVDPEMLDRVEIVRGARSVLYGSDAIGGLINLITKKGPEDREGFIGVELGSHDTHRLSSGIADSLDNFFYSVSLSHENSDGIDAFVNDAGQWGDDDAYEISNANIVAGYQLGEGSDVSISHFETQSEVDFENQFNSVARPYSDTRLAVTNAKIKYTVNELYDTQFSLGYFVNDSENFDHLVSGSDGFFKTTRDEIYWLNNIHINENLAVNVGVDFIDEKISAQDDYLDEGGDSIDSRDNLAFFTQFQLDAGVFDIVLGARNDDNSAFGEQMTTAVSGGLSVSKHHRVYVSWAEGFKAPTFNDMYWPSAGNPDLVPETSKTSEAGFKGNFDTLQYEISVFKTDIDNLIEWAPIDDEGLNWLPSNVAEANITGLELWVSAQLWFWQVDSSVSYVDPENAATEEPLVNRAKKKLTLDASRDHDNFSYGLSFLAQSERAVGSGDPLPGFSVWGLYASFYLSESLSAKVKINNIFDKNYQLNERYNVDGTNGNVKLVFRF